MTWRDAIHIGTSGWHYGHWKGTFYPEKTPEREYLEEYAKRFRTVEINNTFYRLPAEETLESWRDAVPEGFVFAVKASRYITHMKKLKDPGEHLRRFTDPLSLLGGKLGPLLFQLPPNWKANPRRLEAFLEALPGGFRAAFEFRDENWFDRDIYDILARKRAALCVYDLQGTVSPEEVTTDFIYVRLHGPEPRTRGGYDRRTLSGWAGALSAWARGGKEVFCYFNNDPQGHAPRNAWSLLEMLEGK